MSTKNAPIDWSRPLESVWPGTALIALGPQATRDGAPITDEFKYLFLIGEKRTVTYVNAFGETQRGTGTLTMIRNVAPPVAAPTLPHPKSGHAQPAPIVIDTGSLTVALRAATAAFTAATARLAEIQSAMFDGNVMLADELRRVLEAVRPVATIRSVPAPDDTVAAAPAPPTPMVVAAADDDADIDTTPLAKIRFIEKVRSMAVRRRFVALARHAAVDSVVIGSVTTTQLGTYTDGLVRVNATLPQNRGFTATAYGYDEQYDVHVYVNDSTKTALVRAGLDVRI